MLHVTFHHVTGTDMMMVNMHKAKSTLSQLVEAALAGEEVFICRRGKAVVQIVPIKDEPEENLRPIGLGVNSDWPKMTFDLSAFKVTDEFNDENDPNDPLNW